ncbi:MAG: hypothetical protein LQ343_000226 [Gyalolechia ehrenbergii]|nr:MAG: hypothetical protein LQ343_000226 [Gyalolechia ehrenbergii]
MLQIYDPTSIYFLLLLAATLISVDVQAIVGASSNASNPSLPVPTTCPATSVNPIVQTLPQQCFATAWPGKAEERAVAGASAESLQNEPRATETIGHPVIIILPGVEEKAASQTASDHQPSKTPTSAVSSTNDAGTKPKEEAVPENASDGDNDSPLDNAHFLSFEEWKKQNLAKAGQSADSLGAGKSEASEPRRRPGGINNALDSLGEDTEIEIDFGGFVKSQVTAPGLDDAQRPSSEGKGRPAAGVANKEPNTKPSKAHARSKDAGVTCKERSNYASFDCAATVLKTNPESKSATSVLVENKDSYMLNKCSAANNFFIVELCDDILVDTVVLANFEFFSSIFRTFRVSVSDRYPVKLDKWRDLGTFEAKNNRGIQAFLVEEPQIWARYLRIEFLTHYGHEYYCPVSLLRVHGTTMMEEFNHEMKNSKGEDEADDEEQPEEAPSVRDVVTAEVLKTEVRTDTEPFASTVPPAADSSTSYDSSQQVQFNTTLMPVESSSSTSPWDSSPSALSAAIFASRGQFKQVCSRNEAPIYSSTPASVPIVSTMSETSLPSMTGASSDQTTSLSAHSSSSSGQAPVAASPTSSVLDTIQSAVNENASASSKVSSASSNAASKSYSSSTHPSPPNPTTQESFFKTVHKRLQLLESNSTLSLQYIEEQSRILRDAFTKVEKRQLVKTNSFLDILNTTVLNEVREFRAQYDQIWQSTVLELSSQRQQSQTEIAALNSRLSLLADEVLLQKRIAILQFLLILLCLGLALLSRGAAGADYLEHVVNKSSFNLSRYAFNLDSPPLGSPSSTRPSSRYGFFSRAASSLHRRSPSEESMGVGEGERDGGKSPSIEYEPPTPTSLSEGSGGSGSPEREVNGIKESKGALGTLSPKRSTGSSSSGSTSALKRSWYGSS